MSYYRTAFENLIKAGVPRWYIRHHLLTELIYFSRVYVYYNPYDVESEDGWYATNAIGLTATKSNKYFGELRSAGFPTIEEYAILFDGDEYDHPYEFERAYDRRAEEWLQEKASLKVG